METNGLKDMATFRKLEEIECWQLARKMTVGIYRVSSRSGFNSNYGLKNQLRNATLSVMNNIAEGYGRFSTKEFIRYLEIANGSCTELKSMLILISDLKYMPKEKVLVLLVETDLLQAKILALVKYLKSTLPNLKTS